VVQPVSTKLPIAVSHPHKVFWPEEGYTKLDLVEYYRAIFTMPSPYARDRMLSFELLPASVAWRTLFQKESQRHASGNPDQADHACRQCRQVH